MSGGILPKIYYSNLFPSERCLRILSNNHNIPNNKGHQPLVWKSLIELANELERAQDPIVKQHLNQAIHREVKKQLAQLKQELVSVDIEYLDALDWQVSKIEKKLSQPNDFTQLTTLIDRKREPKGTFSQRIWTAWDKVTGKSSVVKDSLSDLVADYRNTNIFPSDLYRLPEELRQLVLSFMDTETMLDLYHNKSLSKIEFGPQQPHWYLRAERWGYSPGDRTISALDYVKRTIRYLRLLRKEGLLSVEHSKLSAFRLAEVLSSHSSGSLLPLVCPWLKQNAAQATSFNLLPGLTLQVASKILRDADPRMEHQEMLMRLAILYGGNANGWKYKGSIPIARAARFGKIQLLESLISVGANVNLCPNGNLTALHLAAEHGHVACVKTLLREGANVNQTTTKGLTPLHLATLRDHGDCVQVLKSAGAKNVPLPEIDTPDVGYQHYGYYRRRHGGYPLEIA